MPEKNEPRVRYWFPAKRYGYGWGLPATWEGWLVFGGYFAVMTLGIVFLLSNEWFLAWYLGLSFASSAALLVVCYLKGEPPSWRWGERD